MNVSNRCSECDQVFSSTPRQGRQSALCPSCRAALFAGPRPGAAPDPFWAESRRSEWERLQYGSAIGPILALVAGLLGVAGLVSLFLLPSRPATVVLEGEQWYVPPPAAPTVLEPSPHQFTGPQGGFLYLFARLQAALGAHSESAIMDQFDVGRLLDECVAQNYLPKDIKHDLDGSIRTVRKGLGADLAQQSQAFQWELTEIRQVQRNGDNEAVVVARHKLPRDLPPQWIKMRWWLVKENERWQVFDMEDLDEGTRATERIAHFLPSAAPVAVARAEDVVVLNDAIRALRGHDDAIGIEKELQALAMDAMPSNLGDADGIEKNLKALGKKPLPANLESVRLAVLGILGSRQHKYNAAVAYLEKARNLRPDLSMVDFHLGFACNRLGRPGAALRHLQAYRTLVGDDDQILMEVGDAQFELGRLGDAARTFRKVLNDDPNNIKAFFGLLRSLEPGASRGDVGQRLALFEKPADCFKELADACVRRRDGAALEQLALTMRQLNTNLDTIDISAVTDFYLALVKIMTNQADTGIPELLEALQKEEPSERSRLLETFLQLMIDFKRFEQASSSIPEDFEPFAVFAAYLHKASQYRELRLLVKTRAKKQPNDPLLPFYQAVLLVRAGRFELADKTFAQALAQPSEHVDLEQFRADRVRARYQIGKTLEAYAQIGPAQETCEQLAALCWYDGKYDDLRELLDSHARDAAESLTLQDYWLRLLVHNGRVADAALLLSAMADKPEMLVANPGGLHFSFCDEMAQSGRFIEAYANSPDRMRAFDFLAGKLMERHKFAELEKLIGTHREYHVGDPQLLAWSARVLLKRKAWDKAAQVLAEGINTASDDDRSSLRSRYALAMFRAGRSLAAYNEAGPEARKEVFVRLAQLAVADKKTAELESLIAVHRTQAKDSAELLYFSARAKLLVGRAAEAIPLLQQAYQKYDELIEKHQCVSVLALELAAAGRGLDGYKASPDKKTAFPMLADVLVAKKNADLLDQLLCEHGKNDADDPMLARYA